MLLNISIYIQLKNIVSVACAKTKTIFEYMLILLLVILFQLNYLLEQHNVEYNSILVVTMKTFILIMTGKSRKREKQH